jgi:hypothetical protein
VFGFVSTLSTPAPESSQQSEHLQRLRRMSKCCRDHCPQHSDRIANIRCRRRQRACQGCWRAYARFQVPRPDCHCVGWSGSTAVMLEVRAKLRGSSLRHSGSWLARIGILAFFPPAKLGVSTHLTRLLGDYIIFELSQNPHFPHPHRLRQSNPIQSNAPLASNL